MGETVCPIRFIQTHNLLTKYVHTLEQFIDLPSYLWEAALVIEYSQDSIGLLGNNVYACLVIVKGDLSPINLLSDVLFLQENRNTIVSLELFYFFKCTTFQAPSD